MSLWSVITRIYPILLGYFAGNFYYGLVNLFIFVCFGLIVLIISSAIVVLGTVIAFVSDIFSYILYGNFLLREDEAKHLFLSFILSLSFLIGLSILVIRFPPHYTR